MIKLKGAKVLKLSGAPPESVSQPEGSDPAAAEASVSLKSEDGKGDPLKLVAVGKSIKVKGVPAAGKEGGSYQWTTTSKNVSLANDTSQVVTIKAGKNPSSAKDAEAVKLKYTPPGGKPAEVELKVTVAAVAFAKAAKQKFGFDPMSGTAGADPHLSVSRSDTTLVEVTVGGKVTGADVYFTADDPTLVEATKPAGAGEKFDLTVKGKGTKPSAETKLRARLGSDKGEIAATLVVNVYKEVKLEATVLKVHDSTSPTTTLARPKFDVSAAATAISEWYQQAVASLKLKDANPTGDVVDVNFDPDKTGKLCLEPNGTAPGEKLVKAKITWAGQTIIIVKDLAWIYFLSKEAKKGDTEIELKGTYASYMKFIVDKNSYTLGAGKTAEAITVDSKAGTVVKLKAALANDHPVTDGLMWPLSGLSGNPIYVAEQSKTESKERETCGHEVGHSLLKWKDLTAAKNLMHYSIGRMGTEIRFEELPRKYDAGKENQWNTAKR